MNPRTSGLLNYQELFGNLDFKQGDDARSVYSPAAYLADLLQLLDDKFIDATLVQRRPDIQAIPLNAENTFTETPYLDIANEVLETAIGSPVYEKLKTGKYPFQLPFDLDHEHVKKYLHYLEVSAEQLHRQFALQPDFDVLAREYLGLSQAEYAVATTPLAVASEIKAFYQLPASQHWTTLTNDIGRFLQATNLTAQGLRELLFQNLSASAQDSAKQKERSQAAAFFIHHQLAGYVTLGQDEKSLVWSDGSANIPEEWFERVNHFVRLANKSGLSFSDLDLILRNCCGNQLNAAAIRTIAVIKQLHDLYELPIDVACSLCSPLNTLGIGNEKIPQDLFNRIFNVKFADIEKKYIAGSSFKPLSYLPYTPLVCSGDLLAFENKEYRRRLSKALAISDKDLTYIVSQFRKKYAADLTATALAANETLAVPALSLLYRICKLVEALDVSFAELFGLLDLLERDPSIHQYNNFNPLIHSAVRTEDCYRILEKGDGPAALWLVQMLFAMAKWMQANDFTSEELNQILSGREQSATIEANNRSQKIATLDNLYQQFKTVMLNAEQFVSARFSERAARVIHRVLLDQGDGLVCKQDKRLVRFAATAAAAVAYQVLTHLPVIRKEDFMQLGLEPRRLDKLYANLILKGYLNEDGELIERALPATAADFVLVSDFSDYGEALFALIHDFYGEAEQAEMMSADDEMLASDEEDSELVAEDESDADASDSELMDSTAEASDEFVDDESADDAMADEMLLEETSTETLVDGAAIVEASLFPSDLEDWEGLSENQRNELYDNLIFNGYLDAEGNVLQNDFFASPENAADFVVNADLGNAATAVFALIMAQIQRFEAEPLVLDPDIFVDLALTATELDDLVENLKFNEYIDQNHLFTNKRALLTLTVDQFNLALAFYPQRRAILAALKAAINAFKADFYTLSQASLVEIADAVVAQQVVDRLAVDYLSNQRVAEERSAFFLDRENLADFMLGIDLSASDHALIFDQIAAILTDWQRYRLPLNLLAELDFDADERAELLETLIAAGYITADLLLPADKISYFLNINNALEFAIEDFTDYNKDIFFALHALAKESAASIDEIVAGLKAQADGQVRVLFEVLQDALGAEVELVKVACQYLLRGLDQVVEEFMLPILATIDSDDTVSAEPDNNKFNLIYKRLGQFALLASKLGLTPQEAEIVLRDQDLVEKFPEKLTLPEGVTHVDALLEDPAGVIYLFKNDQYWAYSAKNYTLLETPDHLITSLSDRFTGVTRIDAAFTDSNGTAHLVAGGTYFYKEKGSTRWVKKARGWGQIQSNFVDPAQIDTAFQDEEGKTYLFAGTQYIRYSNAEYSVVDEGYPRTIADNWEKEGLNAQLPSQFKESIDASFQDADEKTYLFKNEHYVASDARSQALEIRSKWGKVRNNFQDLRQLDAAYSDGANVYFFAGDQVMVYQDSIENDQVSAYEGYPRRIETHFADLPAEFESGLEAAFRGEDAKTHLFKNGRTVAFSVGKGKPAVRAIRTTWGVVTNKILQTGRVDAAFVGLDGKTYLFSDNQYVRYSGADYTAVDEGYPRTIAEDWGALQKVDAAFVLDGKTYLFGADASGNVVYLCYSKKDYTLYDEGYPKAPNDNWWNLPAKLVQEGAPFARIDAVFSGRDNRTYLFSDDQFIAFDNKHRWWSEPQPLRSQWDSIPFAGVDAAFVGKDGKTYIFYEHQYVRYSSSNYTKIDDRYPNAINTYWGNVINNIAKTGRVDAALVVQSHEVIEGVEQSTTHTYLFAGNQYFRYAGNQYATVENGYPKYIATSLQTEPRFKNLPPALATALGNGIDAAFADQRTVYLFQGAKCYALSEVGDKIYTDLGFSNVSCAFLEEGGLFVEEGGAWQRYSALEGKSIAHTAAFPATLRNVPDKFKQDATATLAAVLDAVLQGVDNNTYLFKGPDCFNVRLNREYPLSEEWGRARNNIELHNTIDAAFVGRDHKTYLFSGDQFFTYAGQVYTQAEMEDHPKLIKAHWGGLNNVVLAFVKDQKTYLFEKANAQGNFRYLCYSGADYSQPDPGYPQIGDKDFWQIPANYRDEGFGEVMAVLFEGDNMFLLSRDQFVQYNDQTDLWSYPRPLSRIWRGMPLDKLMFPGVKTAFTGLDGTTYFFAEESYVCYSHQSFTRPASIREDWGLARNNFTHNAKGNKVDAAFVYQHKITYLFSGDQYVRYSGKDYRYVDIGYPKPLLGNLRQEEAFKNLPTSFEDRLIDRIGSGTDPVIDAVVANARNLYLLMDQRCYVVSQQVTATYDLSLIGRVKNHLVDRNRVDASFVGNEANGYRPTFLFSGDQYVRYSTDDYTYVDDGYPRSIAAAFTNEVGAVPLPAAFNEGLDAALRTADGTIYLFKGKQYLNVKDSVPKAINSTWGKVRNGFVANPTDTTIDAAFLAPSGGLYIFKGDQYIGYQTPDQEFVDEGYPKSIKDNWGNLPVDFEAVLDGAFVFEGKTYLVKGDAYVRYSDNSYQRIDSIYPQAFQYRWGAWADYLLSDLKTITRFKELQENYANADGSLADFLNPPQGVVKLPFATLSALFGWDIDELKWLKRRNGFLGGDNLFEETFQLELIIKLFDIFATAQKIGAAPSDLFANVWQTLYETKQLNQAAATLYRYLAQGQSEQDWQTLARQIHNELNLVKRAALLPVMIAGNPALENARDLYERYLIDVEMGGSGVTSRIQEAIAATHLYLHRYFVNLEQVKARGGKDDETRRELKSWWTWMKNYRVWEANRKVFLYPENYIRPELRDTKTPAFKTLEEDLLQGEITQATAQRAYKKYLDEYTEVSRLTIAGGYVYQPAESNSADRNLVIFGRTKTDPRRYYYRLGEFFGDKNASTLWTPWLKVDVQIDADKVYPVYAFDRVFVFWAKLETVPTMPPTQALTTEKISDKTQSVSSSTPTTYTVKIYYSFYNLNKEWVSAQTLSGEIKFVGNIDNLEAFNRNLKLFVESSDKLNIEDRKLAHDNIVINCTYPVYGAELTSAFYLTPELYTERAEPVGFTNPGLALFANICDEPASTIVTPIPGIEVKVNVADVVMFNTLEKSTDGPWFSFDYKGGSFLCKPVESPLDNKVWPNSLSSNNDGLPDWPQIDAAFATEDRKRYFFRNQNHTYVIGEGDKLGEALAIQGRWGKVRNNVAETGVVDAALLLGDKTYLFSGNQYLTYANGLDLADADCPKTLSNNDDNWLPKWSQVNAAFTDADGKTYFFNNASKQFVTLENGVLGAAKNIKDQWGQMRGNAAPVVAAFVLGDATYLAYGNQYVRYLDTNYSAPEVGYPQTFKALTDLANLKNAKLTTEIDPQKLAVIFYAGNSLYFQYKDETQLYQMEIKSGNEPDKEDFRNHLNEEPLVAVALKGTRIYAFKRKKEGSESYDSFCVYNLDSKEDEKKEGKESERKGKWESHAVGIVDSKNKKITIDHALVGKDGNCYLFAGEKYMKSKEWVELIERKESDKVIRWNPEPGTIAQDWLRLSNRIAETGLVDAAFVSGNYTYLFAGDQYIRYTGKNYAGFIDDGYPKLLQGNTEKLPSWSKMGAVLKVSSSKIYFFDNASTPPQYVEAPDLDTRRNTSERWGMIRNNFTVAGVVDTAYRRGDFIYLTSGDQFIRYTLTTGEVDKFVDAGYPKTIALDKNISGLTLFNFNLLQLLGIYKIDAAFTRDDSLYLFSGIRYFKLPAGVELDALPLPAFIRGNWANLPYALRTDLDGALQEGETLFLFKGAQYARYLKNTGPYEIIAARYDIIRLTTSTAYMLNQRLFAGGVAALLNPTTQEIDELPAFSKDVSTPTTIKVKTDRVNKLPVSNQLDFESANGLYYWEIFFHAPFLIAQALNIGQKFEEAKTWYEYIFDPTERTDYWRFLPFRAADSQTMADANANLAQIKTYLNDPFDPHAIAALRPTAYRKAIVMAYVDDLLDWGDMLFRQYTRESIDEARMLYILAYDLLGEKPQNLGVKVLAPDQKYLELRDSSDEYDLILYLPGASVVGDQTMAIISGTPHESVGNPYFFVPDNSQFSDYWSRVEDRLYKIRHSLNILGISQPLPLFEPPIDPMALVQAVGSGAALSSALANMNIPVPHYRFTFMLRKAQDLVQRVSGLGNDLLSALEKKDAEELNLLQNRQEGLILTMTRAIKAAQVQVARETIQELETSLQAANNRVNHYSRLITEGLLPIEEAQIVLMLSASYASFASVGLKISAGITYLLPDVTVGLFSFGAKTGGIHVGDALSGAAEAAESLSEGLSMTGEALGVVATHMRSVQDWTLQLSTAQSDVIQIGHQLEGARWQEKIAQRELEIQEQEIAHNAAIKTFMQGKFSNAQLYQWMIGKLSGLYFQTYSMAYDMAKAAEKALQFERGLKESEANYIQPLYWESQRSGLLAGESLSLDLDRMEKAYIDSDSRGFEITKNISLLELDPVAMLQLKSKGVCEFSFSEALFDYDFPGHYCRQVKTVTITFVAVDDQRLPVNATLTQLGHKTVLEPDAKAVKYLLDPKDQPPATLRSDWKANQQIALSHVGENGENNGMFELRFDDDRYFPFEGTGAVSTWRLELNGKKGTYNVDDLLDVTITLKYTAEQGGAVFATAVKGMLKPYPTARFFNVAEEFPDEWAAFLESEDDELVLTLSRDLFPNMSSSKITSIFAGYQLAEPGVVSMVLNGDNALTLKDGKFLLTSGLSISSQGSAWTFTINGDTHNLENIDLVLSYKASVE